MKSNTLIWACLFIIVVILSIFYIGNYNVRDFINNVHKTDTIITTKTDTLWKDTTIIEKEFVPKIIVKTKTDTLFKANGDTVQLITESKRFDKSIVSDKDTADVEIYTSGINTSLDSLKMSLKTHREIITKEIEITKYIKERKKFKDRFHISPQVGVGYGFINRKVDVYAGIGLSFDLY